MHLCGAQLQTPGPAPLQRPRRGLAAGASPREADDQGRQSAQFAHIEALLMEAATLCQARSGALVEPADVHAAQHATNCATTTRKSNCTNPS
ncbi:Lon-insertion domain-containing protein [Acidovorax sp. 106]|uniref:Lon-insertion domain-containing protein n=1 Tax=Acidovorax sp. 106 TaxID=2135637 RepID=UPI00351A5841